MRARPTDRSWLRFGPSSVPNPRNSTTLIGFRIGFRRHRAKRVRDTPGVRSGSVATQKDRLRFFGLVGCRNFVPGSQDPLVPGSRPGRPTPLMPFPRGSHSLQQPRKPAFNQAPIKHRTRKSKGARGVKVRLVMWTGIGDSPDPASDPTP